MMIKGQVLTKTLKKFSAGEEGGLDEAQEEVLPDDAKCVHEDNNLRQQFETLSQIYRADLSTFDVHCKHFLTLVIFVHCVVKQSTLYFLMVVDPTDIQQKYFYMAWKVRFCETEDLKGRQVFTPSTYLDWCCPVKR